jgi:hypothetical protein
MKLWRSAPTLCLLLLACDDGEAKPRPTLSREALLDPLTCEGCHPAHYREWKASMHAYAADDPVFIAMNELGQQETDGGLGDFCVQCHAPMAVREGATSDGRNLDELPPHLKGVTCYFCHNIESVEGDHNAQLTLANDTTMRGGIMHPVRPDAHRVQSSNLVNGGSPESSRMCGACHDIVNGHGVHLERTFAEYKASTFSAVRDGNPFDSCASCHMDERIDFAAKGRNLDDDREVHSHLFAGVDVPLTPWPDREAYTRAVECALADSAFFFDEVPPEFDGLNRITVQVETNAGHNMPSGSAQDRRLWVELTAYDELDAVVCTNGAVPDDQAVVTFLDKQLCGASRPAVFRDIIYDADGVETHMFWRAAPSDAWPDGFSDFTVQPPQQDSVDHGRSVTFELPFEPLPARLRLRLRIRAMDLDVLEELLERGLLDESIPGEIPTFTIIGGERELRLIDGRYEWEPKPPRTLDCKAVACEFTPEALTCK